MLHSDLKTFGKSNEFLIVEKNVKINYAIFRCTRKGTFLNINNLLGLKLDRWIATEIAGCYFITVISV